jgi:hypothetical protein
MNEKLTHDILDALQKRAAEYGDPFHLKDDQVQVRCFQPEQHKHGDANPSASYTLGKYIYCFACGFKEGENRLAERLGIIVHSPGLTLIELAKAKNVPHEFLQLWGWRTQQGKDKPAKVVIPWFDENGIGTHAPANHFRHYINIDDGIGPRFTWDLPQNVLLKPYGVWRVKEFIETAKKAGIRSYIFITESEMDALTCWFHEIPACAIGGAQGWRSDWGSHFMGFEKVIIAQEPGTPGEQMITRIGKGLLQLKHETDGKLPDILACPFPEITKDMNAIHLSVGGNKSKFREILKGLMSQAVPVKPIIDSVEEKEKIESQRKAAEEHGRLVSLAGPLLTDPAVLYLAINTIEGRGVVGERRNIGLIRLAIRSRALKRPVNVEVNSPSGTGKTHVVVGTLSLEDSSSYYELTAGSERALIYLDAPLNNRTVYIQEPEGLAEGVGAAVLKSLVWEGRVKYDTVVKEDGGMVGRHIEKEGPTGLIICSTKTLEEQITNRLLRVEVDSSEEQTRRILESIAKSAAGTRSSVDNAGWHAMSILLGTPIEVIVLFAEYLANLVSVTALRIRRDFTHLLTLIAACAVEHNFQRTSNEKGQIMATVADYAMVYSLVDETFRAAQAEGILPADRTMVEAVIELTKSTKEKPGETPITQAVLRSYLKLNKSSTSYRVNRLLKLGYLINLNSGKGHMQLTPGTPLPDKPEPLPSPCKLAEHLVSIGHPELIIPWVDPLTGVRHDCREHLEEKYFDTAASTSQNPVEPSRVCKPSSGVSDKRFTSVEPIEPAEPSSMGVPEVQPKLNPEPSGVGSKPNASEGSMQDKKDIDGKAKCGVQPTQNDGWGEI